MIQPHKKSLVDPYSRAAQDVSAVQAHLETLARYKYMLNKNIVELPSYRDPPWRNTVPAKSPSSLVGADAPNDFKCMSDNPLLCIVLIFAATEKNP